MILIDNQNITDPRINLALEEYALIHLDLSTEHLLFYINEPSVIIGKHQNTHEEVNHDFISQQDVHVVRRISGGGAVYHDLGNLNFSILTMSQNKVFNDYALFTAPVIAALQKIGVAAELTGRNDIAVQGRKISGNAQYRRGERMFCHGTLLFDSNIDAIVSALNVKADKIQSKGIKSIRSRVANISEFLAEKLTMQQFKEILIQTIFAEKELQIHHFSQADWQAIKDLAKEKYQNWDWNYGKSPEFNVQHRERLAIGEVDIRLHVKNGLILEARIYGDFFAAQDVSELEKLFLQQPYDKEILRNMLSEIDLTAYFGNVNKEEFLRMFF